jgi:hypothetical protein
MTFAGASMNVFQSLLSGIRTGQDRLAQVARSVAGGTAPGSAHVRGGESDRVDLSSAAVELIRAEHQVAVSARALARADDAEDDLLDVLA